MHFPPVTALEGDDGSHGDDEGCREAAGETSVGWRRCLVAYRGVEGCTSGHLARGAFVHDPLSSPAVDHVVPDPESSLVEAFERWREWADGKACCDYALHVDIPRWSQRVRQELHAMVQEKGLLPFLPCPWLGVGGLAERGTWWMRCPCSSGC